MYVVFMYVLCYVWVGVGLCMHDCVYVGGVLACMHACGVYVCVG